MKVHPDFSDFVAALNNNKVEYVIVGSFALAFHGYPRATGDIDFWIRPVPGNVIALRNALAEFGFALKKRKGFSKSSDSNFLKAAHELDESVEFAEPN